MVLNNNLNRTGQYDFDSYGLEFSSGIPYSSESLITFKKFYGSKLVHNYFPAAKIPFVLNLASLNNYILNKTIDHCKSNIDITEKYSSRKIFSVHAGFLHDLEFSELGNKISRKVADKKQSFSRFIDSIKYLCKYAEKKNVHILIENNVLINENLLEDGSSPFFCTSSDDIIELFDELDNIKNIGLLFDTAHFKVSCKTLNLDIDSEFLRIKHFIGALHHSDNDGYYDSNEKLTKDYWFLKYIQDFQKIYHVLEVKNLNKQEVSHQIKIMEL